MLDVLAFVLAWGAASAPLPRGWVEHDYANGMFAALNRALVPLADRAPFAVGDAEAIVVLVALVVWWVRVLRLAPRGRKLRAVAALRASRRRSKTRPSTG